MYLPIKQEAKLFLCNDLTQNWLESLSNDLRNDFIHHVAAGNRSKILKGLPFFLFGIKVMNVAFKAPNTLLV